MNAIIKIWTVALSAGLVLGGCDKTTPDKSEQGGGK